MRKLSEIKDKEALKVMGKMIEPIQTLTQDKEFMGFMRSEPIQVVKAVKVALVNEDDQEALMCILAALNGVEREEYHVQLLELPSLIISLVEDEDLMRFFQ